jgi:hypothetical protein
METVMTAPEARFAIHPIFAAMLACSSPTMTDETSRMPIPEALKRAMKLRQDEVGRELGHSEMTR